MNPGIHSEILPPDDLLVRTIPSPLEFERARLGTAQTKGLPIFREGEMLLLVEFASSALARAAAGSLERLRVEFAALDGRHRPALLVRAAKGRIESLPETDPPALAPRLKDAAGLPDRPPARLALPDRTLVLDRPYIMGVVNVTPDSFYDGGRYADPDRAVEHALELAREGADILDVGGQSSRPGNRGIAPREELDRVLPVVRTLVKRTDVPVSVDTSRTEVARACADAGASIVNDIRGLRGEGSLIDLIAERRLAAVIMHMRGSPATMQEEIHYDDLISDILWYLAGSVRLALERGVPQEALVVDPGIGFGKTVSHNLEILHRLRELAVLGLPVAIGASRKSFIGMTLDRPPDERLPGTHATTALAVAAGAHIIRVHDVSESLDVSRMAHVICSVGAGPQEPDAA